MFKKITRSLSIRLFIWLLAVMMIGFASYVYQTVKNHHRDLMEMVFISADRISDLLKKSTRYGMLINRKEDIHQIINTVSTEPGVDGIRIYNKKGDIVFSSQKDEIGQSVDMRAEACIICHAEKEPLAALPNKERHRVFRAVDGHRMLGVISPIENEPECYNAPCHAHDKYLKFLGVFDVKMSLAFVDVQLYKSRREMIMFACIMVIAVGFLAGSFIYFFVSRRIKDLIVGTEEIAAGNLDYQIATYRKDEIGQLAKSFNKMTTDLSKARTEITEWSNSLEEKVQQKSLELTEAQAHIMQMERLASLGKLSATVAHEINNPLAGVLNYAFLILRMLNKDELTDERRKNIIEFMNFIKNEVERCGNVVKNMLVFARQTGSNFVPEHLIPLIESSLMLVRHHMELKNIHQEKEIYCENDQIVCDAGQIRQALVALFVNAIEAMDNGGTLRVFLTHEKNSEEIELCIQDTGFGISEDILPNIFDPFFSTKKDGKGVGLGLAVVYGIIQRHKGTIRVESKVEVGTTFNIRLQRNPNTDSNIKITQETIENI